MTPGSMPPDFTLEGILDVYRLVFNAAIDAVPARDIDSITVRVDHLGWGTADSTMASAPVTTIAIHDRDTSSVDVAIPEGLDPLFPRAYRKWNHCERACWMVKDSLVRLLEPAGFRVEWAIVKPVPDWFLFYPDDRFSFPAHSVLLISRDDSCKVLDLTIEQYGHSEDEFLQEDYSYVNHTMPFSDRELVHVLTRAEEAEVIDQAGLESNDFRDNKYYAYWRDAKSIAEGLFENLDWSSLEHMDQTERASLVEGLVIPRFQELTSGDECYFYDMENVRSVKEDTGGLVSFDPFPHLVGEPECRDTSRSSTTKLTLNTRHFISQQDLRVILRLVARVWKLVTRAAPDKFNLSPNQLIRLKKQEATHRWGQLPSTDEREACRRIGSQPQASEATRFYQGCRKRKDQVSVYDYKVPEKQRKIRNFACNKKVRWKVRLTKAARYSGYTKLFIHTALANWNMCDRSLQTLLPLLRKIITDIDPSAVVEWLIVRIAPKFILVLEDDSIEDVIHSVIRITAGGRTVMFDPAGAQFGNRHTHHPIKWSDYKRNWIMRNRSWDGPKYTTDTAECEREASAYATREAYWTYIPLELVNEYRKFATLSPGKWWLDLQKRQEFLGSIDVAIRNAKAWY
ncbi:hypothetical protein K491DRAFT_673077 [Lophiostoma macrostomum CBS 122681]|uniref:Uncharacterized protein n=1 Tax=Lophiostoma macrostomum CBS 122681 TaxID=1314788 RepID=A0A6A6TTR5_9PLEO|nr:hypothetical protein K491DRAFT_673077 [Lophiostoma macrostomum CBS 122681]